MIISLFGDNAECVYRGPNKRANKIKGKFSILLRGFCRREDKAVGDGEGKKLDAQTLRKKSLLFYLFGAIYRPGSARYSKQDVIRSRRYISRIWSWGFNGDERGEGKGEMVLRGVKWNGDRGEFCVLRNGGEGMSY